MYRKAEISFTIQREIGTDGQNAQVLLCHDPQLNADLAIKKLDKSKLHDRDVFFQESQNLYLSQHPNVVQVLYACEDADFIYLAMPYYERGSINNILRSRSLSVREIIRYATHFLSGLHNIHSKRLIHFDVKPDNILISNRDEAMISDFGLSKFMDYRGFAGQDRLYFKQLPPEAIERDIHSVGVDIYQAGISLYRMCNGNVEFYRQFSTYGDIKTFNRDAFKYDVKNERFPDRNIFPIHIPSKLRKVIRLCLAPDVSKRYKSAIEVLNAIAEIDGNELDWYFSNPDDTMIWEKHTDGKKIRLVVKSDKSSEAVKIGKNDKVRRIVQYCKTKISDTDIQQFLKDY